MKKILCLYLVLLMIFSASGCSNNGSESSENTESTEESKEFVMSETVAYIDGYMGDEIDRSQKTINVFKDLRYSYTRPPCEKYPDKNFEKLTNGETMEIVFDSNTHVGWESGGAVAVNFELPDNSRRIGDISVGCARIMDYGVGLPKYVTVAVSDNGNDYTEIGKVYTPDDIPATARYVYHFAFPKAVSAKYIRIIFSPQDNAMLLVDEIFAFEYSPEGYLDNSIDGQFHYLYTINDFYGYDLNTGESEVKVSPDDADYNEIRNLATIDGVEFQIQHFDPFFVGHSNTGIEKIGLLTDGKLHGNNLEEDYFIFYRGAGRHVVADLGTVMSVKGCKVSFKDKHSWGISTPPVYYISVSENGTDWVTVFAEHNPDYGLKERNNDTRECNFENEFKARYVRITFPTVPDNEISSSVYMGEFEVIGRKNPENAVAATEKENIEYGVYPDPVDYGVSDILFAGITDGIGKHCTDYHVMSEDSAYHYMVSVDENDNPTGVLFDSFALTTRGDINWDGNRKEGYSWYLEELFYEGVNMDALNSAKGKINDLMGTNDKATVWISLNCPIIGDTFDGKTVTTAEDYIECIKWQIDTAISLYNEKEYENIELIGFYWQVENIRPNKWSPDNAHDKEALLAINEYIHELGYLTLWCPYYSYINGIWHSKYYGFDITCWQPNYMFSPTEPTRLDTIAELAKIYGVGIEIEIEANRQSNESLEMYRTYLGAGVNYGFINSINAYYQGAIPGAYVVYRNDGNEINKTIYDETVKYIQGTLESDPNTKQAFDMSVFSDGEITVKQGDKASINLGSVIGLDVKFTLTPIYGSVKLNYDGTLTYTAMRGYVGNDTVEITLYDGVADVKTITVKVTVTE